MTDNVSFGAFASLDIRVGTLIKVEKSQTNKPTWKMTIDFGDDVGTRVSCGAYTNYDADALTGNQVICVMNLGTIKMGPEKSEVLVLGVAAEGGGTIPLTTLTGVRNGVKVF